MTGTDSTQHTRALALLVVATFFWGLSFPLIKAMMLLHERLLPAGATWFSTVYAVAPRFLLGTLLLVIWRPQSALGLRAAEWRQGMVIGLFAAAGMLFQNDGLQYTAASTSAFLTQLYAILIPVWLAVRARRNPGVRVWVCCALVLAGVAILGRFNWREFHLGRGEWETLLGSVFFMGQILWLEKREYAANRPLQVTFAMFATEAVVFCALALAWAPDTAALLAPWRSVPWLALTAVLTVFCTVGAFWLMNAWQPKITATEAGLIYCVEPVFASALALFLPGLLSGWIGIAYGNEVATWPLLVGGGLITVANIVLQKRPAA
jgi:drug/metabolite transporter (DMT)-like permease